MNETRFIELLNLYVDHQLSEREAAELEVEIARNTVRRNTYLQYCRMQKACTVLFEQERSHAPASRKLAAALAAADRKIVAFPEEQKKTRRGYYPVGLLAAAACVAFVFARFSPATHREAGQSPEATVQMVAAPHPEISQPVSIPENARSVAPSSRSGFYSVFAPADVANARVASGSDRRDSNVGAIPVSYSWMRDVELTPLQSLSSERLSLKASSLVPSEDRLLHSRKPVKDDAEMSAAFQFQR